jgi:DNA-binding response OmpR family regulator
MTSVATPYRRPLKCVIADEIRAIQNLIKKQVLIAGYLPVEIEVAADGLAMMELIEKFEPDLIIMDWHLPKCTGLELLHHLRKSGRQRTRVGFVCAEKTLGMMHDAKNYNAAFLLAKPLREHELAAGIQAAVTEWMRQPVAPGVGALASQPVQSKAFQEALQQGLGNVPFKIEDKERMRLEHITETNYLGLFSHDHGSALCAIAVIEGNALALIGQVFSKKSPMEVRAAAASGQVDEDMHFNLERFLQCMAQALSASWPVPGVKVTLSKKSLVKKGLPKLAEILAFTQNRSDFKIVVPGYGDGRVSFFVLTP